MLLAVVLGLCASTADAQAQGMAFGRLGGNIMPFRVGITAAGTVNVTGPVQVARRKLTAAQVATVRRIAANERFSTLPIGTNCAGALPDVATTYVVLGGRTVHVHGRCMKRFNAVFDALSAAVKISY